MYIEKISIVNFKSIENLEFDCNKNFNVVIGQNSIGKTTIFEALNLWKYIYNKLITKCRKKFYKANSSRYMTFKELNFLRISEDDELFHDKFKPIYITLLIAVEGKKFSLKYKIEKPKLKNIYFRISNAESDEVFREHDNLASFIREKNSSLQDAVIIHQTHPISNIRIDEPFYNNAQINKKIVTGKPYEVLRNKILKTLATTEKFSTLEAQLKKVFDRTFKIKFKNQNRQDDEFIRINIEEENHNERDIALFGSGFLQVLEVFSTLGYSKKNSDNICLILIDEPDSHLHSDIQSKLVDQLREHDSSQIILITHNDRLMKKTEPNELFYLDTKSKLSGKLLPLESYEHYQVKRELAGGELEIDSSKPLIITEGKTDREILITAWEKINSINDMPFDISASGFSLNEGLRTGGASAVRQFLEYLSVHSNRKIIGLFDNDKEGRSQFKGLNKNIFEKYSSNSDLRKHQTKDVFALCLEVPCFRNDFVKRENIEDSLFCIEHYFDDNVLESYNMKGEGLYGSNVFRIKGDKNNFSKNCRNLDKEKFKEFEILFKKILEIIR